MTMVECSNPQVRLNTGHFCKLCFTKKTNPNNQDNTEALNESNANE